MTPITAKLDIFEAFKHFKAFAENQSKQNFKTLRDDKGGEYISMLWPISLPCAVLNASTLSGLVLSRMGWQSMPIDFCLSTSLLCWTSQTLQGKAFWGDALAALVHVWNRCPTDAVDGATPYELWLEF